MQKYTKLYAWIWKVFDRRDFSLSKFRTFFRVKNSRKVVHDLIERGCLRRIERGRYKAIRPKKWIEAIANKGPDFFEWQVMTDSKRKYAFYKETALMIWTTAYFRYGAHAYKPLEIKVKRNDLDYWKVFFNKKGITWILPEEAEKKSLIGVIYIVHPKRRDFKIEEKNRVKVIPLKEAVNYAKEMGYEEALEYIDEHVKDIGYKKREYLSH